MSNYAIGDIQGCYSELLSLLDEINFDDAKDRLWFTGDIVNRGPASLQSLRFVKSLSDRAVVVLGNHELHLLAIANGQEKYLHKSDTIDDILGAHDRNELLNWLRYLPLMHEDTELGFVMVHAGLAPDWSVEEAQSYANEVEEKLRGKDYLKYFAHMYGNTPAKWSEALVGWDRLRTITNYFTRLRFCDEKGKMDFDEKNSPGHQAAPYLPWFEIARRASAEKKIIFGHWAALRNYHTDYKAHNVFPLDTGCLWGGRLSALRLEDEQWFSVPSEQKKWSE
ncbi:MAG: symmetrical bis(5'-nucleosyl)-tetraphosphatase [Gammaproteobacteria bacterium]|nr:symmetrical bis(5'-nucleosyl)-tetraphosphatase [Gammaproteobacteria bacterium]